METSGLGSTWEANEVIRGRIRSEKKLFTHPTAQRFCEPNRVNAVNNSEALMPALKKLKVSPAWKLPHLEDLQGEIIKLFKKLGVEIEDSQVYTTSVECKKLLGFVKRRVKRGEVTKDPYFCQKFFLIQVC